MGGSLLMSLSTGRRGAALRSIGVEALTACFEDICTMVDAFTRPGKHLAAPQRDSWECGQCIVDYGEFSSAARCLVSEVQRQCHLPCQPSVGI
jgi:hypothetical protein